MQALVANGMVLGVGEVVDTGNLPVEAGWYWDRDKGFKAPPPPAPWRVRTLDLLHEVEAFEVTDPTAIPAGVNVTVVDGETTRVATVDGVVALEAGDWVVRLRPDATEETMKALAMDSLSRLWLSARSARNRLTG